MRKLDYEKPFSDEDIAWLRQAGFMSEERIANHQAQFDKEVPEPETNEDELTRSALDAQARVADPFEGTGNGAPVEVDPKQASNESADSAPEDETDDYDAWKVAELEAEVQARNDLPGTSTVTVEGTGKNGTVTKPDLVKGLRLWDQENPEALKD